MDSLTATSHREGEFRGPAIAFQIGGVQCGNLKETHWFRWYGIVIEDGTCGTADIDP